MLGKPAVGERGSYRQQPQQSWLGFAAVVFAVLCLLSCVGFGLVGTNRTRTYPPKVLNKIDVHSFEWADFKARGDVLGYLAIIGVAFGFTSVVLASAVFMQVNKAKTLSVVAYVLCFVGLLIVVVVFP